MAFAKSNVMISFKRNEHIVYMYWFARALSRCACHLTLNAICTGCYGAYRIFERFSLAQTMNFYYNHFLRSSNRKITLNIFFVYISKYDETFNTESKAKCKTFVLLYSFFECVNIFMTFVTFTARKSLRILNSEKRTYFESLQCN